MQKVTLTTDDRCADCGAGLRAGETVKRYGNGKVYGTRCHGRKGSAWSRGDRSRGARNSHLDPHGAYAVDGTKLGSSCSCEDYPCCGH